MKIVGSSSATGESSSINNEFGLGRYLVFNGFNPFVEQIATNKSFFGKSKFELFTSINSPYSQLNSLTFSHIELFVYK